MSECYYSYYSLINPIRKALDSTDKPGLKELWHKMSHDVACNGKDAKKAIHLLTEDPLSEELMTEIQHFDYHMPWELENVIRFQFRKTITRMLEQRLFIFRTKGKQEESWC